MTVDSSIRRDLRVVLEGIVRRGLDEGGFEVGGFSLVVGDLVDVQVRSGSAAEVDGSTRFDVASLTKVLSTWPLVVSCLEREELTLLTRMSHVFPRWSDAPGAVLTVADLLTHSAGLKQETRLDKHMPFESIEELLLTEPLDRDPGVLTVYGNRAFILLGRVLEIVTGQPLGGLFDERVAKPFDLGGAGFDVGTANVVPTLRAYSGEVVTGVSHDRNAELLGGAAGHAGLFLGLDDAARLTQGWLAAWRESLGWRRWVELSTRPWFVEGSGRARGLAWYAASANDGSTVAFHHGFTGGSVFVDFERQVAIVVLTDSVNCGERHPALRGLRDRILAAMTSLG